MSQNVITDGVTRSATIDPVPGLHDGLVFEYHPMLAEDVEALDVAIEKETDPKKGVRLAAASVVQRLLKWSEVNKAGAPMPVDFESVRRLPYPLLFRTLGIIKGRLAADVPAKPTEQQQIDGLAELQGIIDGKTPGAAALEAARKN